MNSFVEAFVVWNLIIKRIYTEICLLRFGWIIILNISYIPIQMDSNRIHNAECGPPFYNDIVYEKFFTHLSELSGGNLIFFFQNLEMDERRKSEPMNAHIQTLCSVKRRQIASQ